MSAIKEANNPEEVLSQPPQPEPRKPRDTTYRGWKEVGGWEQADKLVAEDELEDLSSRTTLLEEYLPVAAYGDWYHHVGYIIGAGLLSWLVGWFRFSLAPVFVILVAVSLVYRASMRKYRAVLREQAQKEFSIKKIESDFETMDWLNTFLDKYWVYLEPSVSQIVCEQINPLLAASPAPAFIKALWLDSFTAGTKPPRIDHVKTLPKTSDDVVVMDWGMSFTPYALADAHNKMYKNKVNQKVVVKLQMFGVTVPVAVSDVSFKVNTRVRVRMMTAFPHVETINVSLLDAPQFDFTSRLFGDSIFNWEVLAVPGLLPFINDMVKKYAGPMLIDPMSFQLNVQQLLAGNALDSSIGVLAITTHSARGLKRSDSPDPFLTFGFDGVVLGKTSTKKGTLPAWNETTYILVRSLATPLHIGAIDYNEFRKNKPLGAINHDLSSLILEPSQKSVSAPFMFNNKPVGELLFDLQFYPVLEAETRADGAVDPPPDLNTGVARIEINEAKNVRSDSKKLTSYVEIQINKKVVYTTKVLKANNTPSWNTAHEEIIFNRRLARVSIVVKNKSDDVLGAYNTSLNDLIDSMQVEKNWFSLGSGGGEIRLTAAWKPVGLSDVSGSGGYTEPIGVVRVQMDKAEDLKNLETVGTIDPYLRLMVNGFQRARTSVVESTLNPVFNEVHYITITSPNQRLTIEAMDVESVSDDRTLGSFDVKLNDLISKNDKGEYNEYVDLKKRTSKLLTKKGARGFVTYSLSFYPTVPVMTLQDIKEEADEEAKRAEEAKKKAEEEAKNPPKEDAAAETETTEVAAVSRKKNLSLAQLLEYQTGVFVFKILGVDSSKSDLYLQAFFDKDGYASFESSKLENKKTKIGLTSDYLVRELDWSITNLRLSKKAKYNRAEEAVAEITLPTIQLLQNSYQNPQTLTMGGGSAGSVQVQCRWIPVLVSDLPMADSIANSGHLKIQLVDAEGLPSADRNGYSDPYVELYLNNTKNEFFKSKTKKKTLSPVWNEETQISVGSRAGGVIKVQCNDWDMGPESDDKLGTGYINLEEIDPLQPTEMQVALTGADGKSAGVVNFKFSFKPEFVITAKAHTSSVSVGGGAKLIGTGIGAVGGGGVKAVGSGLGAGVKVVGKGGQFLKKGLGFGKKKDDE
ncbi:hypothetical protein BABINDRAFT_171199 [Babjeviella inositovora NRRL Y-12698]|uniref:Tricalbin n=1 Tax=Babjeviella inositovora NRRL Y-12698 TaxID=984486 RepID=A0A1E3QR60_9ASCO|nr:uncharacterized protein BABINDRAFT_171199 [Babjeviella inositovora NRRL Y-12698]ODQ80179.1 hypothetical protein BABINDRAFT_171199 [Babjeviella inositovora NRRL Y-12698]